MPIQDQDCSLMCLQHQRDNKINNPDILFFTYEDFCNDPLIFTKKIQDVIPEIGILKVDAKFSAHNFKNNSKMKIQNLNSEKIAKLDASQLKEINEYFSKEIDLLDYFGYSILQHK